MNDFASSCGSLAHDIGNPPLDIQVKSDREYFSIGKPKNQKSNGRI
jgi:hypothetical protein